MAAQEKPAHGRRGSLGFGSGISEDFEKLLQQHFGGPDDAANSKEPSPLFSLTSDGTMLQELLQTLENGGTAVDVAGGRMFSDDTINAIMGEHFREYAADVIKEIREGKDPREIRVPATAASPAVQQAVTAAQLGLQVSSNGSMSLREVQLSMQQAQQQQAAVAAAQQQQQLQTISLAAAAPSTVLVQPQLTVNTGVAAPSTTPPQTMMALPTLPAQTTLMDQQQQQPMIAVQGQVVQNADGTQSVMIDPNMAMQAMQQQQQVQPATTTTIQHVQVPVQQQQQVMVQVAGANGMMQYVPVLESRIVGYASQPVAVTTTTNTAPQSTTPIPTPPATTPAASQSEAMLASTQQLMASAVAQQQQLQAFSNQGGFGRVSPESLSRSTSDTAAQAAAALANEQAMLMNAPLPSRLVSLQPAGVGAPMSDTLPMPMATTAAVAAPQVMATGSPVGFGLLATTTTQPQLTAINTQHIPSTFPTAAHTLQPAMTVPQLRPASDPFPIPGQQQQQHVVPQLRPAAEQMVIPGAVLHKSNVQHNGSGSGGTMPRVLQATLTPTASPPMTTPTLTAAVAQQQQQFQHDATTLAALPTKPCHKRERSIRSDNPFLADPTTAPDVKCAKGSPRDGGGGGGDLGNSPDSALMNGYLAEQCAGVESSSGDASPLAQPDNNTDHLQLHMLSLQQQQQQRDQVMAQSLHHSDNNTKIIKQEPSSTTNSSSTQQQQRVTRSRSRPVATRGGYPLVTIPETTDVSAGVSPIANTITLNGNGKQDDLDMPSIQELIQQTLAPLPGKRRGRPPGSGRHIPDVPGAASEPTDAEILEKLLQEDPQRRLLSPDELKKVMRKEKNRISAAISRHNTQVYTNHLENQVRKLEEERVWYAEALDGQQIQQPPHRVMLEGQGTSVLVPKPPVRHVSV